MFEGKTITLIKKEGHARCRYELWTQGGITFIWNDKHIKAIDEALQDAKKHGYDERSYLRHMIDEEGILLD